MNTLSVHRVSSKTHMLVMSAGFCSRVTDWSIHVDPDMTPKGASLDLLHSD